MPKPEPKKNQGRAVPPLARNQKPLETVAEAERQIAGILRLGMGGRERYIALTGLLSRAYAGKPNNDVIRRISSERDKIRLNLSAEKKREIGFDRAGFAGKFSNGTQARIEELEHNLVKFNPVKSQRIIRMLQNETPRNESQAVASWLESKARGAISQIDSKKINPGGYVVETIRQLYYAAGDLFIRAGQREKAGRMYEEADKVVARFKFGL